jgi:hypothetical protein
MNRQGMKRVTRQRGVQSDAIARAFKREREREARFWPVWQPDFVVMRPAEFKCVCSARNRKAEERREPESEMCVRCVRAAGFAV